MSMEYFDTLLPNLIENKSPYTFLYEVKPNVTKEQIKMFADAKIIWIQPGVESFNDRILKLLRKGTTTIINIQFIKWAMEFGLYSIYNVLYNIPMEEESWYEEMNEILPLLFHLQPPNDIELRFDRFSYYYLNQKEYNLELEPIWTYKHVYPFSEEDLLDFAFFLQDKKGRPLSKEHKKTISIIKAWNDLFYGRDKGRSNNANRPVLFAYHCDGGIYIEDTRPCKWNMSYDFLGVKAYIYELCDKGRSIREIEKELLNKNYKLEKEEIEMILDEFILYRLMIKVSEQYLSLAVFNKGTKLPDKFNYMGRVKVKKSSNINNIMFDLSEKSKEGETIMENDLKIKHDYIPEIKRFLELYCGDSSFRDELMKKDVKSTYCNMNQEEIEELRPLLG